MKSSSARAATSAGRWILGAAIVVATAAVGLGLGLLGSPDQERDRRLDARRVDELRAVARAIDVHWHQAGTLPATLAILEAAEEPRLSLNDPESGEPYSYQSLADDSYELCASFSMSTQLGGRHAFWSHPAGLHCFRVAVEEVPRESVFGSRVPGV